MKGVRKRMKKRNKIFCPLCNVLPILLATIVSGCSMPFSGGYGANGLSREAFSRYVEDVFRLQNRMTSEVMMLLETGDPASSPDDLLRAERQMHEVCASLNEYADRDIEGQNIGFFLQRKVEKSAVECEQAAFRVETLLRKQ